jgi:hypothetical protein
MALVLEAADGVTSKDLAILLRCPTDVVRRRLAEMKRDGLIAGTGEFRRDAAVVKAAPQMMSAMTG